MKKIEKNKPDASSVQSNGQKTLFHFFGRKTATNTPVEKVVCPACSAQVPKSKINFHLDHDCKSNVKNKKNKRSAPSNKKNSNAKDDKAKTKKRAVLSDSEDDFDDMSALDMKNVSADSCDSDSNSFCLSSSMVEVLLSEESTDAVYQPSSQNLPHSSHDESTSPYFSPDSKKIQRSPGSRQEKVIVYDLPSCNHSAISRLLSDWASPEKVTKEPQTESTNSSEVNSSTCSPHTKSGKAVKAMLDEDWNTSTPVKSKNLSKTNVENGPDDFEENSFIPSTPKSSHSPRKRSSQSFISNVTKFHENKVKLSFQSLSSREDSCNEVSTITSKNSVQQESENCIDIQIQNKPTSEKISDDVKAVNGHSTAHELSPGSDSTELLSPELVTPVRSSSPDSSPSPPKAYSAHVKKLFPPDPSESDPKRNNGCIPALQDKVGISSELQTAVKTLPKIIPHGQSSQDDIFNALSMSSSQVKRPYRSPRKFHQGLKKTGLLEHSSQAVAVITPRKKTRSLSIGGSSTPDKLDGSQPSPSKSIEDGDQQIYDKANYRHYKGYYLENFLRILDTVMDEPQDVKLFNDEDLKVIDTFRDLTLPAQKLYVRLFQRKIKWNKVSKIEYKDICDAEDTQLYVNELIYADFLLGGKIILCLYSSSSRVFNLKAAGFCK